MDFRYSYSLEQLISLSTRITESTATLIDHFFTKSPHKIIQSDVIKMSLSDQELMDFTRKNNQIKIQET